LQLIRSARRESFQRQQSARFVNRGAWFRLQASGNRHDQRHGGVDLVLGTGFPRVHVASRVVVSDDVSNAPRQGAVVRMLETSGLHRGVEFLSRLAEVLRIAAELDGGDSWSGWVALGVWT